MFDCTNKTNPEYGQCHLQSGMSWLDEKERPPCTTLWISLCFLTMGYNVIWCFTLLPHEFLTMMNCFLKIRGKINPFLLELYCPLLLTVTKLKKEKANTESCLPRSGEAVKINLSIRFTDRWNLSSVWMCKRFEFGAKTIFKWCKQSFVGRMLREWQGKGQNTVRNIDRESPAHRVSEIMAIEKRFTRLSGFIFEKEPSCILHVYWEP